MSVKRALPSGARGTRSEGRASPPQKDNANSGLQGYEVGEAYAIRQEQLSLEIEGLVTRRRVPDPADEQARSDVA
jgi:hypothetical protein